MSYEVYFVWSPSLVRGKDKWRTYSSHPEKKSIQRRREMARLANDHVARSNRLCSGGNKRLSLRGDLSPGSELTPLQGSIVLLQRHNKLTATNGPLHLPPSKRCMISKCSPAQPPVNSIQSGIGLFLLFVSQRKYSHTMQV